VARAIEQMEGASRRPSRRTVTAAGAWTLPAVLVGAPAAAETCSPGSSGSTVTALVFRDNDFDGIYNSDLGELGAWPGLPVKLDVFDPATAATFPMTEGSDDPGIGHFTVGGVPAGTYVVRAHVNPQVYVQTLVNFPIGTPNGNNVAGSNPAGTILQTFPFDLVTDDNGCGSSQAVFIALFQISGTGN